MTEQTPQPEGLTYRPSDLAQVAKAPKRDNGDLEEYGRRDKAWASLRKMVAAGRSNRQLERAARALN